MENHNNDDVRYRFTAYLIKAIQSHRNKYIRKKQLIDNMEELMDNLSLISSRQHKEIAEDRLIESKTDDRLEQALRQLKARDMQIVLLHLLEDYSLKEIAEVMGINYNSVRSTYIRAVKRLRDEIREDKHDI